MGSVPNTAGYLHGTFAAAYGGGGEFRFVDTVQDPQGRHQYIYNTVPGTLERIGFGMRFYQGNSGVSGWLDDIAVATGRIGCD